MTDLTFTADEVEALIERSVLEATSAHVNRETARRLIETLFIRACEDRAARPDPSKPRQDQPVIPSSDSEARERAIGAGIKAANEIDAQRENPIQGDDEYEALVLEHETWTEHLARNAADRAIAAYESALSEHPETGEREDDGPCADCGGSNLLGGTYWFADNPLWNEVVPDKATVLCAGCFTERCDEQDVGIGWRAGRVGEIEALVPPEPLQDGGEREWRCEHPKPDVRCNSTSPYGERCDLLAGHDGRHEHDNGPLGPRESRHNIGSWDSSAEQEVERLREALQAIADSPTWRTDNLKGMALAALIPNEGGTDG